MIHLSLRSSLVPIVIGLTQVSGAVASTNHVADPTQTHCGQEFEGWGDFFPNYTGTGLVELASSVKLTLAQTEVIPESISEGSDLILDLFPEYFVTEMLRVAESAKTKITTARGWGISPAMEALLFNELFFNDLIQNGFPDCLHESISIDERRLVVYGFIEGMASLIATHWQLRVDASAPIRKEMIEHEVGNVTEGVVGILQIAVQRRVGLDVEDDAIMAMYRSHYIN